MQAESADDAIIRFKRSLFLPLQCIHINMKNHIHFFSVSGFFHQATRSASSSYIIFWCMSWKRALFVSALSACSQLTGPTRKWCSKRRPWIETLTLRVARSRVSLELAHSAHRALRADGRCRHRRTHRHQARAPKTWCCRSPASPPPRQPTQRKRKRAQIGFEYFLFRADAPLPPTHSRLCTLFNPQAHRLSTLLQSGWQQANEM